MARHERNLVLELASPAARVMMTAPKYCFMRCQHLRATSLSCRSTSYYVVCGFLSFRLRFRVLRTSCGPSTRTTEPACFYGNGS